MDNKLSILKSGNESLRSVYTLNKICEEYDVKYSQIKLKLWPLQEQSQLD